MIEGELVARFAWALVAADTGTGGASELVGGRIYRDRIEQGAALPAITIAVVTAVDFLTANGDHVKQDVQIDVTVRGEGETYEDIYPIAARVFTVLQGASLSGAMALLAGAYIPKLRRVESAQFQNSTAGKSYAHIVQTFFAEAQPT